MSYDVFISHSVKDEDQEAANRIYDYLEGRGIKCFMDKRDLIPGESFPDQLTKAIEESGVVVLVFSANSDASSAVQNEITIAAGCKIPIVPVRIENTLPHGLKFFLASPQWADAFPPPLEKHLPKVVEAIKHHLQTEDIHMDKYADYYKILQIDPSAEPEVIEAAYKKLAQKYHPDVNASPHASNKMKEINIAHDVLSDPEQRKAYDVGRRKEQSNVPPGKQHPAQFELLLKDHYWHDIEFGNLPNWVKKRKPKLDAGKELVGSTFRYRFNTKTGKYQLRLRYRHGSAIFKA
jgi:hypothetical protein